MSAVRALISMTGSVYDDAVLSFPTLICPTLLFCNVFIINPTTRAKALSWQENDL